ncbi:double zinc ribbon domain-containing protein [Halococcus sp. AFM35]|uniref:double zinc ribbon domain-containing protein n=1 Tax=Halococcus sp. AFM35 TaxID=3421653 RepID=UPI003EB72BC9
MTWNCPDCGEENSDESIWCEECGTERTCQFCGEPVREGERQLANGEAMAVIECPYGDTKHRFRSG